MQRKNEKIKLNLKNSKMSILIKVYDLIWNRSHEIFFNNKLFINKK